MSAIRASARVPGSSANLGGGFDCVGMAVDRWIEATVVVHDEVAAPDGRPRVLIRRAGALAALDGHAGDPADDLLVAGFVAACRAAGAPVPSRLAIDATSDIPVARGLGSSAAAVVAGARLADHALGLELDDETLATACARVEGHPDNVAPSVFGGAVLGVPTAGRPVGDEAEYAYARLRVHPSLAFAFAVPDFPLSTLASRGVLPAEVTHRVATLGAGRGAALVQGLAGGDLAMLAAALDDVLHVPFRRGAVRGYDAVERAAVGAGAVGLTLSGSGSTLVAIVPAERGARVAEAMRAAWAADGVAADAFVQHGEVRSEARPAAGGQR